MRKTLLTSTRPWLSRFLLLTPLLIAPLPLSCVALVSLLLVERLGYRGLLIGWALLFATLFILYRDLPHAERIWHMGLALSMGLSGFILYFLPNNITVRTDKGDLWQLESQLLALKREDEERLCTPDPTLDQWISLSREHEEAVQEISSLEGVVENLLNELKRRSVPTFPTSK